MSMMHPSLPRSGNDHPAITPSGRRAEAPLKAEGSRGSGTEREFLEAIAQYQETSGRMFPTWSEVLEVARGLGYAKDEPAES